MYLKSLKVVGFKSFADRTRLEFEPGVNVVVGPNGSGKSNLVDAVAWVLGTQAPTSLRTDKMEDVIFAGTAGRPALGRGEVTLVFDNASGTVPLELEEVAITRRLFRDGTSEYEINGVGCRLLDIQDLLADSGVGKHQHIIVGQGQLGAVLNASPADHRAVIEEAAGVLKHRHRKDRSLRRLERTDADLLRLNDILAEIDKQMRSLRRQANAAEKHGALSGEVKALQLWVGGETLRGLRSRLAELRTERAATAEEVAISDEKVSGLETDLPKLVEAAGEAGSALERDSAAAARMETAIERLRRIAQVAHERHRAAAARAEGAGMRRRDLQSESQSIQEELASSSDIERTALQAVERTERLLRALEDEERSLSEQEAMPHEGAVAVLRGDLRALEAAKARDEREHDEVKKRLTQLRDSVEVTTEELDSFQIDIERLDSALGPIQQAYDKARLDRDQAQDSHEQAAERLIEARSDAVAAEARLGALVDAANGSVLPESLEAVSGVAGLSGSVVSALDVPQHLAAAVDAALGTWAEAIAATSPETVAEAVAALKQRGLGGVPFVTPLSTRPKAIPEGMEPVVSHLGVGADKALAASLLGDVVLVEGWSQAWRLTKDHPQLRFVTPEGDILTAFGVRVGNPDGATPAVIEGATVALEAARVSEARQASLASTAKRDLESSRTAERAALEQLELLEAELAGATEALGRLSRRRGEHLAEMARLEARDGSLVDVSEERAIQVSRVSARLEALEGEEAERQAAWEALTRRKAEVGKRRDEARTARQVAATELGAVTERRMMLEQRFAKLRGELQNTVVRPVDPAELERLRSVESQAKEALVVAARRLEELRVRQAALREEAGASGTRLEAARTQLDTLRRAGAAGREVLSKLAIEEAQLEVRDESVAEGLRRDADATEEEALAAPTVELVEGEVAAAVLISKEAELRRLGPVNPLAVAEFKVLSERSEFLTAQITDLDGSRRELKKLVATLDGEIQTLFLTAFEEVSRYYERHFGLLFPGGRGRIRLEDPTQPMTSGVEIDAQPLGKKVSKLTLLSGGERSLAALAFLFAIFKARPSPFYILDEVEAALDDSNLRRFLRLVDEFRGSAQLMIITHQQHTMDAADILYGVTMEPGGSSQVLAKRLHEVALVEYPPF